MTVLDYTLQIPLPAPLTSGSGIQSYTDPSGEIWVASNGVKGGNWYRARDVLKCRVFRAAAYTFSTTLITMIYDSNPSDPWGLYNTSNGIFTCPLAGWYRVKAQMQAGSQAAGSYLQLQTMSGASATAQVTNYYYATGIFMTAIVDDLITQVVGGQLSIQTRCSTAVASTVAAYTDYATFEYIGIN